MNKLSIPTTQQVKAARVAAGLTQQACADCYGYGLRDWQQKEEPGKSGRAVSVGGWHFLMLLSNQRPPWTLRPKVTAMKRD